MVFNKIRDNLYYTLINLINTNKIKSKSDSVLLSDINIHVIKLLTFINTLDINIDDKLFMRDIINKIQYQSQCYEIKKDITYELFSNYHKYLKDYDEKNNIVQQDFKCELDNIDMIALYWKYNYSFHEACLNINGCKRNKKIKK